MCIAYSIFPRPTTVSETIDLHDRFARSRPVDYEQFGMLCSIDGQARQLVFRVADNSNLTLSRSHFTESVTSLSAAASASQTNKSEVLQYLAKAIAEERCLLDKVRNQRCTIHRARPFVLDIVAGKRGIGKPTPGTTTVHRLHAG